MHIWSKLSAAQWIDAWEERFAGNPNLMVEYLKSGKSARLTLFCESKKQAEEIQRQWGGSVREMKSSEWNKPVPPPRPVKVRDVFLLTAEADPKRLAAIQQQHPARQIISIPPEMGPT